MYETIRIVEKLKPKYVIWENVKNLLSKKHRHNFDAYLEAMESMGYKNYYQVLNAKDYGIPQNRERVFTISILSDTDYLFTFPKKQELKLKLKDMLEENVDEKYYLSDKMVKYISATGTANFNNHDSKINLDIARPITTDPNKRAGTTNYLSNDLPDNYDLNECVRLGGIFDTVKEKHQAGSIYDKNGISPTLDTMQGGWRQPCIYGNKSLNETLENNEITKDVSYVDTYNRNVRGDDLSGTITTRINASNNTFLAIKNATKKGYLEATEGDGVDISSRMQHHRGTVQKEMITYSDKLENTTNLQEECLKIKSGAYARTFGSRGKLQEKEVCDTLTASMGTGGGNVPILKIKNATAKGYLEATPGDGVDISSRMKYHRGNVQKETIQTIDCTGGEGHGVVTNDLRIRKLTPKECWRLMGFEDKDFDKAEKVNSNAQLYKQAGNSIVVNVLQAILKELFLQ